MTGEKTMKINKKILIPSFFFSPFALIWPLFLALNIAFSESPANSILTLFGTWIPAFAGMTGEAGLPLSPSWQVTLGSFGASIKNAFFGVGLGNFGNAFAHFRPISANMLPNWYAPFHRSASPALTVLVEQGLIGLSLFVFLGHWTYKTYKTYKTYDQEIFFSKKERRFVRASFSLTFLCFIFFIFDFSSLLPFFSNFKFQISNFIFLLPLISFVFLSFLFGKKRLPASPAGGQGGPGFSSTRQSYAVGVAGGLISLISLLTLFFWWSPRINPAAYVSESEKNFAEAEKLASVGDKTKIKQLVASSLTASQKAISLNPGGPELHQNYLNILSHLSHLIQGGEKLQAQAFAAALKADPANPRLFLDLGRFQYSQGDFWNSAQSLQSAVNLKPNYAPAWYALSQTLTQMAGNAEISGNEELKKTHLSNAKTALTQAKNLVCAAGPADEDCKKLKKEL